MKYKVELSEGCTAFGIDVNGKSFSGEDPRYCLSPEEQAEFVGAVFAEIRRAYDAGELSLWNLFDNIQLQSIETSETACETCGDYVTTRYYEF